MTRLLCSLWLFLTCLLLQARPASLVLGSFVPARQSGTASGQNYDYDIQNEPAKSACDYDAALMLSTGERKPDSSATRPLVGKFVKSVAAETTATRATQLEFQFAKDVGSSDATYLYQKVGAQGEHLHGG